MNFQNAGETGEEKRAAEAKGEGAREGVGAGAGAGVGSGAGAGTRTGAGTEAGAGAGVEKNAGAGAAVNSTAFFQYQVSVMMPPINPLQSDIRVYNSITAHSYIPGTVQQL